MSGNFDITGSLSLFAQKRAPTDSHMGITEIVRRFAGEVSARLVLPMSFDLQVVGAFSRENVIQSMRGCSR
jgi:hypothetical protein